MFRFTLLFLLLPLCSRAEPYYTYSLIELSVICHEALVVQPDYGPGWRIPDNGTKVQAMRVTVVETLRSATLRPGDTVWLKTGEEFSFPSGADCMQLQDTVTRMLIHGDLTPSKVPILEVYFSAIQMMDRRGQTYYPIQTNIPGSYQFYPVSPDFYNWRQLIARAKHYIQIIDDLLQTQSITNDSVAAERQFQFLTTYQDSLTDMNNGWGTVACFPYDLIIRSGNCMAIKRLMEMEQTITWEDMIQRNNWCNSVYFDRIRYRSRPQSVDCLVNQLLETWLTSSDSVTCARIQIWAEYLSENLYEQDSLNYFTVNTAQSTKAFELLKTHFGNIHDPDRQVDVLSLLSEYLFVMDGNEWDELIERVPGVVDYLEMLKKSPGTSKEVLDWMREYAFKRL